LTLFEPLGWTALKISFRDSDPGEGVEDRDGTVVWWGTTTT
jgi:hypothetical protein